MHRNNEPQDPGHHTDPDDYWESQLDSAPIGITTAVYWGPTVPEGWQVTMHPHPEHEAPVWEINRPTDPHDGGWIIPVEGIPTEQYKTAYRCSVQEHNSDDCMPDWYTTREQAIEGCRPDDYHFHQGGDVNTCARMITGPLDQ